MDCLRAPSSPANDNRDLFETPEGAYFQVLRARRRHLAIATAAMTPGRFRGWRGARRAAGGGATGPEAGPPARRSGKPAAKAIACAGACGTPLKPRPGENRGPPCPPPASLPRRASHTEAAALVLLGRRLGLHALL